MAGSSASPGAMEGPCVTAETVLLLPFGFLAGSTTAASGSASEFCWQKCNISAAGASESTHSPGFYLGSGSGHV